MTRPMGSYYVVGYGEDIRVPTVDMVITEKTLSAIWSAHGPS